MAEENKDLPQEEQVTQEQETADTKSTDNKTLHLEPNKEEKKTLMMEALQKKNDNALKDNEEADELGKDQDNEAEGSLKKEEANDNKDQDKFTKGDIIDYIYEEWILGLAVTGVFRKIDNISVSAAGYMGGKLGQGIHALGTLIKNKKDNKQSNEPTKEQLARNAAWEAIESTSIAVKDRVEKDYEKASAALANAVLFDQILKQCNNDPAKVKASFDKESANPGNKPEYLEALKILNSGKKDANGNPVSLKENVSEYFKANFNPERNEFVNNLTKAVINHQDNLNDTISDGAKFAQHTKDSMLKILQTAELMAKSYMYANLNPDLAPQIIKNQGLAALTESTNSLKQELADPLKDYDNDKKQKAMNDYLDEKTKKATSFVKDNDKELDKKGTVKGRTKTNKKEYEKLMGIKYDYKEKDKDKDKDKGKDKGKGEDKKSKNNKKTPISELPKQETPTKTEQTYNKVQNNLEQNKQEQEKNKGRKKNLEKYKSRMGMGKEGADKGTRQNPMSSKDIKNMLGNKNRQ